MREEAEENGNTSWSTKLEQEMVFLYTNFVKHSEGVCECYNNVPHHRPVLGAQNDQTETQTAPVLSRHGDGEEGPPPGFEWIAEYMDMLTQYPKEEFYIEYSGKVARERLTEAFDTLKNMKENLTTNEKIWKQLQSLVRAENESCARELRDAIRCMTFLNKKLALALDGENASPSILMRPPGEYTFDELS
ncbi:hypothetical protein QJS10_CPB12g00908 [Acorus calamus]|uniref:Uncharacterized protein n=1 Tax=Acorus calamus TaxID=4465 RepID=A0AAV9DNH9_ACOCL|nr:hypothetical protein QJS10_CPB12g00908 [Acorus calamus]